VAALQLRTTAGADDPARLLAAEVSHMLDLLTAAWPGRQDRRRVLNASPANGGGT
jgi:hypothetical protein